jgi:uncharacterized Zn-binding protein involved in type VI secretion
MAGAARMQDKMKQDSPHCHAPIHPAAPVPTAVPHPGLPLDIVIGCPPTVKTNGKSQATLTNMSKPCMLPSCVPAGPGMIALGSATVIVMGLPAARQDDMCAFTSCVAPIPAPVGKIISPVSTNVEIGG